MSAVATGIGNTGLGYSIYYGKVQTQTICRSASRPLTMVQRFTGASGNEVYPGMLAVDIPAWGGLIAMDDEIKIVGRETKTVRDKCPICSTTKMDHFSDSISCRLRDPYALGAQTIRVNAR